MSKQLISSLLGVSLFFLIHPLLNAQSGNCDQSTPFYQVDLSDDQAGVYISPNTFRSGLCCGITTNIIVPKCVEFEVKLDPKSQGFILDIETGLIAGLNEYLVDCTDNVLFGEPFCKTDSGPFTITYCKPGSFPNTFSITSIPSGPQVDDITALFDCTRPISVSNLVESTVTWTDITSGSFAYNAFLDCTSGCLTTNISPDASAPASIQYQVCGELEHVPCSLSTEIICDTATVFLEHGIDEAEIEISTTRLSYCEGENILIEASTVNGGNQPKYTWFLNGSALNLSASSIELDYLEQGDSITAELKSSLNCILAPNVSSNALAFEIKEIYSPSIEINEPTGMICMDSILTLSVNLEIEGDDPMLSWWIDGEEVATGSESTLDYIFNEIGEKNIEVRLVSSEECTDDQEVAAMTELEILACTTSSVNQINSSAYNLFPNPSTSRVQIVGDFSNFYAPEVSIIGVSGLKIMDKANVEIGQNRMQIDLSDFHSGMYFVKIMDASKVVFMPFYLSK